MLKVDTIKLNKYFNETTARLVSRKSMNKKELTRLCVTVIRNDRSTGYDHIPASFIKPVSEFLVLPRTFLINNLIKINQLPDTWKLARISPIPKIQLPVELKNYRPITILPIL